MAEKPDFSIDVAGFVAIRKAALSMPDLNHPQKSVQLRKTFPNFSLRMLEDYSRYSRSTDHVVELFVGRKVSMGCLQELCTLKPSTQDILIDKYVEGKWTPVVLVNIKKYLREGRSMEESIGRSTGTIDPRSPRIEKARTLDSILDEISKDASRWRAKVAMAMDVIEKMELQGGVEFALFEKVYLLRHLIGEQYNFVSQKVFRFLNQVKKRAQNGGGSSSAGLGSIEHGDMPSEGDKHGVHPGTGA